MNNIGVFMKKISKKYKVIISIVLVLAIAISSVVIVNAATTCSHVYVLESADKKVSCTKSGSVTLKCKKCNDLKTENTTLGHKPKVSKIVDSEIYFLCENGCSDYSEIKDASELKDFEKYVNDAPQYLCANTSAYYDVTDDGIINAKDYAYLKQLSKANEIYESVKLSNPNASIKTKRVYKYLCDIDGTYTLSAQQESTWMGSVDYEMDYIYNNTGKYPAMRGLDYMNDDFDGVNKRAKEWWDKGGLVTICWHCGCDFTGEWNDACTEGNNFKKVSDWNKMLTEGTTEYNNMIAGMDKAAKALKELQNQGVVVLWRPFHELDGNWFWWSLGGSDKFKTMWKIMYDRYTNYWGLNNLIWVLGYSHKSAGGGCSAPKPSDWYPGDDYCDVIGADTYDSSQFSKLYSNMKAINTANKPIALHECGKNPTPTQLGSYPYAYFMTWHTTYITDTSVNSVSNLKTLYTSDRVITLDEVSY